MAVLFGALLIAANVAAVKLVTIGPWLVPAGVLFYPLTFLVTDYIGETRGREEAQAVVRWGFAAAVLAAIGFWLAVRLPHGGIGVPQESFEGVLGLVPRITVASLIAYLVSQHHDVWAFHLWRRRTEGRYLWLRNNASTMVSQTLDTVLFVSLAFAAVPFLGLEGLPASALLEVMLGQWIVKLAIALLDTPLLYGLVYLRRARAVAEPVG